MKISNRMLNIIFALIIVSTVALMLSGMYNWLFFISIPLIILTFYLYYTKCRCPNCNTWENMDRLMYARKYNFYCRGCGKVIEIDKEN